MFKLFEISSLGFCIHIIHADKDHLTVILIKLPRFSSRQPPARTVYTMKPKN